ncbi:MAG: winged helix-turn-helix transcriptional regulator [Thermoplasmata archaeon]|nr:MAG: winged helix-turn-helix transcriptional regulator [Thermoplasmata archaeon]
MKEEKKKSSRSIDDSILNMLLEDPTKSINEMSKELKLYRQTIWRRKKKLENDKVIWGYTAVIDENKLNHIIYLVLMKMQPMSKGMADTLIKRLSQKGPQKQKIRLIDEFHTNGEFDLIIRFAAPNYATARKYYDTLRLIYKDYLIEKPVIVDVNFILMAEGKMNPEIQELHEFVPSI